MKTDKIKKTHIKLKNHGISMNRNSLIGKVSAWPDIQLLHFLLNVPLPNQVEVEHKYEIV